MTLDRNATDLRALVEEILFQFRKLDTGIANGPHAYLSCQELRVVEYLGDSGPRMMKELAEFLLLAVNSITSIVDGLETKGIVRRQRSEQDRRIVHVELTEAGQRAYKAAVDEKLQLLRGMLAALTEDEQTIFLVLFRKIARAGWTKGRDLASSA
jgi:MarR family 2-MHQ and catechol resistance regulon transcriptional repressor